MSALFPLSEYSEDQPQARTILTTHVLHRGFQSGSAAGIIAGSLRATLPKVKNLLPSSNVRAQPKSENLAIARKWLRVTPPATVITPPQARAFSHAISPASTVSSPRVPIAARTTATSTIIRSTGVGGALGLGAMAVMLPIYMSQREYIEWQDRSWRLLNNEGQVEVDNWSIGGAALGVSSLVLSRGGATMLREGWIGIAGRAGIGSLVGVLGYMVVGRLRSGEASTDK